MGGFEVERLSCALRKSLRGRGPSRGQRALAVSWVKAADLLRACRGGFEVVRLSCALRKSLRGHGRLRRQRALAVSWVKAADLLRACRAVSKSYAFLAPSGSPYEEAVYRDGREHYRDRRLRRWTYCGRAWVVSKSYAFLAPSGSPYEDGRRRRPGRHGLPGLCS